MQRRDDLKMMQASSSEQMNLLKESIQSSTVQLAVFEPLRFLRSTKTPAFAYLLLSDQAPDLVRSIWVNEHCRRQAEAPQIWKYKRELVLFKNLVDESDVLELE